MRHVTVFGGHCHTTSRDQSSYSSRSPPGIAGPETAQPPDDRKIEKLDMDSLPVLRSSYRLLCRYSL